MWNLDTGESIHCFRLNADPNVRLVYVIKATYFAELEDGGPVADNVFWPFSDS